MIWFWIVGIALAIAAGAAARRYLYWRPKWDPQVQTPQARVREGDPWHPKRENKTLTGKIQGFTIIKPDLELSLPSEYRELITKQWKGVLAEQTREERKILAACRSSKVQHD